MPSGALLGKAVLFRSLGVEVAGLGGSGVVLGTGLGLRLMIGGVIGESSNALQVYLLGDLKKRGLLEKLTCESPYIPRKIR